MSEVIVLQHAECETLGIIDEVLLSAGVTPRCVKVFRGEPVPADIDDFRGLIAMGGPMGVHDQDEYPHVADEMRLIQSALKRERPVLGVCLGSQLLAAVLGARVFRGKRKEIGWFDVTLQNVAASDPVWSPGYAQAQRLMPLHWHGDVFELPAGAVSLAASDRTPCQAFVHGRAAYGILFHMEVTVRAVADMTAVFQQELSLEGLDGAAIRADADVHLPGVHRVGRSVFTQWVALTSL